MNALPIMLVVIGGVFGVISLLFIVEQASRWWTGYGVPLGLLGLTTACTGFVGLLSGGVLAGHPLHSNMHSFLVYVIPLLVALYAVFWFLFVSRYLGLLTSANEIILGVVTIPILVAMPMGTTWTVLANGTATPIRLLTVIPNWVLQTSAYFVAPLHFGIAVVGLVALVWGVNQYSSPTMSFASKLVVAGPVWYFATYSSAPVFGLQSDIFYGISVATSLISLAGVWLVYSADELIDQRPTTNIIGRNTVIEDLNHPVLVLDRAGQITDANQKAVETFSRSNVELSGLSVGEILPKRVETEMQNSTDDIHVPLNNRRYEVSVSAVSSGRGAYLGKTLVFRDVTEQVRRKQRVEVLNRVLRHNLRNEGTAIMGFSNLMQEQERYNPAYMSNISDRIQALVQTGQRAQEIDRMMGGTQVRRSATSLQRIIDQSVDRLDADNDLDVAIDVPEYVDVTTNDQILVPMIAEALRNAVIHGNDLTPSVVATMDEGQSPDELHVSVEDSGPGIPEEEVVVIRKGEEEALEHGSGLGLWLLQWGATKIGGSIAIDCDDQQGTAVTMTIPGDQVRLPGSTVPEAPRGEQLDR